MYVYECVGVYVQKVICENSTLLYNVNKNFLYYHTCTCMHANMTDYNISWAMDIAIDIFYSGEGRRKLPLLYGCTVVNLHVHPMYLGIDS